MTDKQTDEIISAIRDMDPYDFERLVAKIWEKRGWDTQVTQGSADRGIDVIATKKDAFDERKHLIQAKRYGKNTKVGSEDVQKYSGLYAHKDGDVDGVYIVTSGYFTKEAKKVAIARDVRTINAEELAKHIVELGVIDPPNQSNKSVDSTQPSVNSTSNQKRPDRSHPFNSEKIPKNVSPSPNQDVFDQCPECGESGKMWLTKTDDKNRVIKCGNCMTGWEEEQKRERGLIFSKETVHWREYTEPHEGRSKSSRE